MSKHLHYGSHSLRGVESVNLNRCDDCGTSNPSLPGKGLPTTCAGCGHALMRDTVVVATDAFTPPKAGETEAEEGATYSTRRSRDRNRRRLMRSGGWLRGNGVWKVRPG